MVIHDHRVKWTGLRARAVPGVVRGKSGHAAIGARPCSASLVMHRGMTRQSHTTCSRRLSDKMADAAEVPVRVVGPLALVAHAVVRVRVTWVVPAAMAAGKVSRAVAIVPADQTTRLGGLNRTR